MISITEDCSFPKKVLQTHDGRYHADDVFSTAFLLKVFKNVEIIRSRKKQVADIIYDVCNTKYDHHTSERKRKDGTLYSSFGLLFDDYSEKIFSEEYAEIFKHKYVIPIDLHDNGVKEDSLSTVIELFNDTNVDFIEAVKFAENIISKEIELDSQWQEEEADLKNIISSNNNNELLFLRAEKNINQFSPSLINSNTKFVIKINESNCNIIPVHKKLTYDKFNTDFKICFPTEVLGKSNIVYKNVKIKFCHKQGHLMIIDKYISNAIKLCKILLKNFYDENEKFL